MMQMKWRGFLCALVALWLMLPQADALAQVATTQIQDTIYQGNGSPAQGSILISWPAFSTMSGQSVPAGTTTVQIGSNGSVSVALVPNAGATPIGTYYTAVYHTSDGRVSREYWVVPVTSSPVTISSIRTTVLPVSVAMQTVSKAYVDQAVSASGSQYVQKSGDTMTGPLVLPGDPTATNQAADKHYVDTNVGGLTAGLGQKVSMLPAGGQTVTQPAGTTLGVNSLNGALYTGQYQTGLNNNGIANVMASSDCASGCTVVAEPSYGATERPTPYQFLGTSTFGWPSETHLKDERAGVEIDAFQNPHYPFVGNSPDLAKAIIQTETRSAADNYAQYKDSMPQALAQMIQMNALAGGNNLLPQAMSVFPYGKSTYMALRLDGNNNTAGQHVLENNTENCAGIGDCLLNSLFLTTSGGNRDSSDEGAKTADLILTESSSVPTGVCSSGCTTGSTQISLGSSSDVAELGEGRFLIDTNPAKVMSSTSTGGYISGGTSNQSYPFNSVNFTGTNFPLSTFFLIPQQIGYTASSTSMAPGTMTVPIASSGVPAGYATNTASAPGSSGVACVADSLPNGIVLPSDFEFASYTVVDATHLSITFNKPHQYDPTVSIGGLCGYFLEQTVDTTNGIRQAVPVMGAVTPTQVYYADNHALSALGVTGGTSNYVNFSSNITSVSRSNNVTTVTLQNNMGWGGIEDLNGLPITITGVADSSFNGSYIITTTGANSFTYANSGSDGSSSGGTAQYVTGGFNLYPGAEVLGVLNPTTNAVDGGNLTLSPNTVSWAANDTVEEPHYHLTSVTNEETSINQIQPRANYGTAWMDQLLLSGSNGPSVGGFYISNKAPASLYYGNGGSLLPPSVGIRIDGAWQNGLILPGVDGTNGAVLNISCNSHGCGKWNSNYNLFDLKSNTGVDTVGYNPLTSTMSIRMQGGSYNFSPTALTAPRISATSSVDCNAGGHKCQLVNLCTTGATQGATCDTTLTWTTPFADANYVLSCTVDGSGSAGTAALSFYNKTASGATLRLVNISAAANTGTANCIADHP
ncbi:MAG: hypothetical protein ACYC46_07840 [Acidobacteriaceae bacterium]